MLELFTLCYCIGDGVGNGDGEIFIYSVYIIVLVLQSYFYTNEQQTQVITMKSYLSNQIVHVCMKEEFSNKRHSKWKTLQLRV